VLPANALDLADLHRCDELLGDLSHHGMELRGPGHRIPKNEIGAIAIGCRTGERRKIYRVKIASTLNYRRKNWFNP